MSTGQYSTSFSICPYCGTGCELELGVLDSRLRTVAGSSDYPVNQGRVCVKASNLPETLGSTRRLLAPSVDGLNCSWDHALDTLAGRLSHLLSQHGPTSVAMLVSGQLNTEDLYVANKLMKGFLGSANIESITRMSDLSAFHVWRRTFGSDLPLCSFSDLEQCELLVMTGINPAWSHPVLFQRIHEAQRKRPDMRIVLIDPRRTVSAEIADLHLPLAPGSDTALFLGLLRFLHDRGAVNADFVAMHTEGFEDCLSAAQQFDIDSVSRHTALDPDTLRQFYQWFARAERTVTLSASGIGQSGHAADTLQAMVNCHLASGRVGQPGMGPYALAGQANALGVRETGALPELLAAGLDFSDGHRQLIREFWNAPALSAAPGLRLEHLAEALEQKRIRALWILGSDPLRSLPESGRLRRAMEACELVVVSECFADTETLGCAHISLPAAIWGERAGTLINAEGRHARQDAFLPTTGDARPDWWMLCEVAARLGFGQAFPYSSAEEIRQEQIALSALAEHHRPAMPSGNFPTATGRARMTTVHAELPRQPPHYDTAFTLLVNRLRDPWLGMSWTQNAPRLFSHTGQPELSLNPRDARSLGMEEGDLVRLYTRGADGSRHSLFLRATLDPGLRDGDLQMPMHWPARLAPQAQINRLTPHSADPASGSMNGKRLAAGVTRVPVQLWVSLVTRQAVDVSAFPYQVRTPFVGGQHYLLAVTEDQHDMIHWNSWLQQLRAGHATTHTSPDSLLCCSEQRVELALFSNTDHRQLPDPLWQRALLKRKPGPDTANMMREPPRQVLHASRVVCHCFQLREHDIASAIREGARDLDMLGTRLRAGTNCGSCIPELMSLISSAS